MAFQGSQTIHVATTVEISTLRTLGDGPGGLFSGYVDGTQAFEATGGEVFVLETSAAVVDGVSVLAVRDDSARRWILSTGGGASFPGFGGAPPAVATASAGGAAGTASRSDHTHALDIVPYAPSAVGMQASGVIQQTFSTPTATPVAFNVGSMLVPFGALAGTGILATSSLVQLDTTTAARPALSIGGGVAAVAGAFTASFNAYTDSASGFRGIYQASANGTGGIQGGVILRRSQGTLAAPTAVQSAGQADLVGTYQWSGYSGTSYIRSIGFQGWISSGSAVTTTSVPIDLAICTGDNTGTTTPGGTFAISGIQQMFTWRGDTVLGFFKNATTMTSGFVWYRNTNAGPPTGVPVLPLTISGTACEAVPTVMNCYSPGAGDFYAYYAGAWHYNHFDSYTPTATRIPFGSGTAGNTTDDAALFYTVGTGVLQSPLVVSNTLGGFGGGGTLTLENNHAAPLSFISLTATDIRVTVPAVSGLVPTASNTSLGTSANYWGGGFIVGLHANSLAAAAGPGLTIQGVAGTVVISVNTNQVGFFSNTPVGQQTVTGSKVSGAALISLLAALGIGGFGLIVDSTTA